MYRNDDRRQAKGASRRWVLLSAALSALPAARTSAATLFADGFDQPYSSNWTFLTHRVGNMSWYDASASPPASGIIASQASGTLTLSGTRPTGTNSSDFDMGGALVSNTLFSLPTGSQVYEFSIDLADIGGTFGAGKQFSAGLGILDGLNSSQAYTAQLIHPFAASSGFTTEAPRNIGGGTQYSVTNPQSYSSTPGPLQLKIRIDANRNFDFYVGSTLVDHETAGGGFNTFRLAMFGTARAGDDGVTATFDNARLGNGPQDLVFVGPANGNWNSVANWSSGGAGGAGVPADGDSATLDNAASGTVVFDGNYAGTGLTQLDISGSGAGPGLSQSANTMVVGGQVRIGHTTGTAGSYSISGGALNVTSNEFIGGLLVGEHGIGALNIGSNPTDTPAITCLANMDVGVYDGAVGAVNHVAGAVTIGSTTTGRTLFIGREAGSSGSYSLSGNGSSLTINGNMQLGYGGHGSFVQNGGTVAVRSTTGNDGLVIISNSPDSIGELTINAGTFSAAYGVAVGGDLSSAGGRGVFNIGDGVSEDNSIADVHTGVVVWPNGTVNINRGGTLTIGLNASDNVLNDGTINLAGGTLNLGGRIYGNGTVNVTDGVATVADQTNLESGTYQFDGGTITASGSVTLAGTPGSTAVFTLNGGSLTVNGDFTLGSETNGGGGAFSQGKQAAGQTTPSGGGATLNIANSYYYVSGTLVLKTSGSQYNSVNLSSGQLTVGALDTGSPATPSLFLGNGTTTGWTGGTFRITGAQGLTIGTSGSAPLGSSLTIRSGKSLYVDQTLTLGAGSQFALAGGSLTVGSLNTGNDPTRFPGNGTTTGWSAGSLSILSTGLTIDNSASSALGPAVTINSFKSLYVGGALTLGAGGQLALTGGSLTVGMLNTGGDPTRFPGNGTPTTGWSGGSLSLNSSGLTIDSSAASLLGSAVTLNSSKSLYVGGTLTLGATGQLALTGGSLSVNALDTGGDPTRFAGNGSTTGWSSGTFTIRGLSGLTIDSSAASPLGATVTLSSSKTLNVTGALSLGAGSQLKLSGGSLSVGSLDTGSDPTRFPGNGTTTGWSAGSLRFNASGLTIDSTASSPLGSTVSITSAKSLFINNTLTLGAGSQLNLSGGSLSVGALTTTGGSSSFPGNGTTSGWTAGSLNIRSAGLTIDSSAASPLGSTVTLNSSKNLTIGGTLNLGPGGQVSLGGGTLTVNALTSVGNSSGFAGNGTTSGWSGGSIYIRSSNLNIDSSDSSPFGSTVTINSAKYLSVSGALSVGQGGQLNLTGGTLSIGSLNTGGDPTRFSGNGTTTGWTAGNLYINSAGLSVDSTAASPLGPTVTIGSNKYLYLGGTLALGQGGQVNLSGGTLTVAALTTAGNPSGFAGNGTTTGWTSGSLFIRGTSGLTIDGTTSSPLGSAVTISAAKSLYVGGTVYLGQGGQLVQTGGSLRIGALSTGNDPTRFPGNGTNTGWSGGYLEIMGTSGLSVDSTASSPLGATVSIGSSKTLYIDRTLTLGSGGQINLSGGSLTVGTLASVGNSSGLAGNGTTSGWSAGNLTINSSGLTIDSSQTSPLGSAVTVGSNKNLNVRGTLTLGQDAQLSLTGGLISVNALASAGNSSGFPGNGTTSGWTAGSLYITAAGLTIDSSTSSPLGSALTINSSKFLSVSGTLTLGQGAQVAMSGGSMTVGSLTSNGNSTGFPGDGTTSGWTAGTLSINSSGLTVDGSSSSPLGSTLNLPATKHLSVAQTLAVGSSGLVNFSAGTLNVGALDTGGHPERFNWTGGTLAIGTSLALGSGGPLGSSLAINSGMGLTVSQQLNIDSGATLTINSGRSVTAGSLNINSGGIVTNSGSIFGPTTINTGGLLNDNGTANTISVSGGTLKGNGSAGAVTANTGGHIAPGASIGHLTVSSLILSGGVLDYELGAPGNGDFITVTNSGGLNLTGGATLELTNAGGLAAGTYTLIDYNSSFTGSTSNIGIDENTAPTGFTYTLVNNTASTTIDLQVNSVVTGHITATFNTGVAGNWSNAGNWTPVGVPNNTGSATYDVVLPTNCVATLDQNASIDTLTFSGTSPTLFMNGNKTLTAGGMICNANATVAGTGAITVTGLGIVGYNGSGFMAQNDGTVSIGGATDSLTLGYNTGDDGQYTITGGTLTTPGYNFLGTLLVGNHGSGTFTVNGTTAVVNCSGNMGVGVYGTGAVIHSTGTVNVGTPGSGNGRTIFIGREANSHGSYSISGSSTLTIYGNMQIGYIGNGTFTQTGGTVTLHSTTGNDGLIILANGPNASGSYTITAGSMSADYGTAVGGDLSSGGGPGTLTIGDGTSSNGTANVHSGLLVWPNGTVNLNKGGTLTVGLNPADNLLNNGTINNNGGTLVMGGRIYGTGTVNTASGSINLASGTTIDQTQFNIAGGTVTTGAGGGGMSAASVSGYTTADNTIITVGKAAGSNAFVSISGGSTTFTGTLGVGNNGTATGGNGTGHFSVSGGSVTVANLIVGSSAGGTGTFTVSGGSVSAATTLITSGGSAIESPAASPAVPNVLSLGALSFAGNGSLDVGNNELLTTDTVSVVRSLLVAHTIFTSQSTTTRALGYVAIGGGATEVRYTLRGDTNLDGQVDVGDLGALATNYGLSTAGIWAQGDFNIDGAVDVGDLGALATNYGTSLGSGPLAGTAALVQPTAIIAAADNSSAAQGVPEPSRLLVAVGGGMSLLAGRHRSRAGRR